MKAIVNTTVLPLFRSASWENSVEDEVLYGMVVDILDEPAPGWFHIRTHYRYEGVVCADGLILDQQAVAAWEALPKQIILNKNCCDVLSMPKVQGWHLLHLPRGGLIAPIGEPENNWQRVRLADSREGYVPTGILGTHYTAPLSDDEDTLRAALVDRAMGYVGTHYRWGGKSPLGMDCSGLTSMAYMLCGVIIFRDARIMDGFPLHEISMDAMKPGDLLFFPGHVAMYIGNHKYCHVTAKAGVNGFVVNSLDPQDPDYRADLHQSITQIGSIF